MVFTGFCFDELLAYKAVSVLIRVFEVQFDPIFAVTASGLNMPFSKLFSMRWPNRSREILRMMQLIWVK